MFIALNPTVILSVSELITQLIMVLISLILGFERLGIVSSRLVGPQSEESCLQIKLINQPKLPDEHKTETKRKLTVFIL